MKKQLFVWAMLLIILGIAGCSSDEDREFTRHEPGVYKGGQDPLLGKEQQQALNDRFKMGQTDR